MKFRYLRLSRWGKGVVIRYLMKISSYSRRQLAHLIARYRLTERRRQRSRSGFKRKGTARDIRLLAVMDEVATTPSCGPVVKKLCKRVGEVFGQTEYAACW